VSEPARGAGPGGPAGTGSAPDGKGERRFVAVVPHTHWDREWYEPFQTFRLKLVELVDDLLDQLERDSSYGHFLLDGQLAVVDDYLEIRPENEARLRALAAAGRLTVGPWYILMDEFLVSGETLVRNLQTGIERGASFGGVMDVGYLPDMFGHVSQMPQLLVAAGFRDAVVWRGVPSAIDRTAFVWEAPDGSEVRAEYLPAGYGNGAALPDDAKALLRRLRAQEEELGPFLGEGDPMLLMNGTDHLRPQPGLGRLLAEANQIQDEFELAVTPLPEYLERAPSDRLPRWRGELRSGYRTNLLMGVGSNRVDVKQAAAGTERTLERLAEPLSALYLPAASWPAAFLDLAWKLVIRNSAHDSVCACSVDDVVDAVLHRYAEARHIGKGLAEAALAGVAASMSSPGPVVVNPTHRDRSGMVEVVVPAVGEPGPDLQVLSERAGLPGTVVLEGETVKGMLGMIQGARIDDDTYITGVTLTEEEPGLVITLSMGTEPHDDVPVEEVKRELYTRLTARPDTQVRVAIDQPPIRRALAIQDEVPGFGWSHFSPARLTRRAEVGGDPATALTLGNGLVSVVVDAAQGTFSLDGVGGYGRLVDDGDDGDTYNYSPPVHDSVVDAPESCVIREVDRGPVRATVVIDATYRWPERVDPKTKERTGAVTVAVETTLEVRADDPVVRVRTRFVNPSRDHRLRVHLPLREPAATSHAECAFTVVERGLTAEGRSEEFPTPTFPSRRFVTAGGLTLVHDGLLEYELVDIGDGPSAGAPRAATLALTLLRATGMLSRPGMSRRPLPAGPMTPVEGPQLLGPVTASYALAVGDVDPYVMADDVLVPLAAVGSLGGGERPDRGSTLTVRGAEVSALVRRAGLLELRVFNPTASATTVEIAGRSGWLVDLRGRALTPFEGTFELRAHGIATARLAD
jgi:Glycosyl hydrolases family 38 N-terminal domain/Alpha mannosidase middle domain